MQELQSEYQSSERAFATWYATMREPHLANQEGRISEIEEEIQTCEKYLRRWEKEWRVLDGIRRRRIGEKQMRLVQLRAEERRVRQALDELHASDAFAYGSAMFSRIRSTPRVARVICEDATLTLITERLYCYGPSETGYVWYRLGSYTITIELEGTLDWATWQTNEGNRPGGFLAPQIQSHGIVKCYGHHATIAIDQARKTFRYDTIANVLVRFTECPGTASEMKGWEIVPASAVPLWYRETPLQWQSAVP